MVNLVDTALSAALASATAWVVLVLLGLCFGRFVVWSITPAARMVRRELTRRLGRRLGAEPTPADFD